MFKSESKTDASPTIEGFVYQAYLTIERWMSLTADEALELERGEDIDIVCEAMSSRNSRNSRGLEQIKHEAKPLSLTSTRALTALSRFLDHQTQNPAILLSFRFITTARIARERRAADSLNISGIELWESLRSDKYRRTDRKRALATIRKSLSDSLALKGFKAAIFGRLAHFTADASEKDLLSFIRQVEWSTGNANRVEVEKRLLSALVQSGHARSPSEAVDILGRLLLHVLRTLSTRGIKKLTKTDLDQQLARPPLTQRDSEILAALSRITSLEQRVSRNEAALDSNQRIVTALSHAFDSLGESLLGVGHVEYSLTQLILDKPQLAIPTLPRPQLVATVVGELGHRPWVSIVGEPGAGKTQLCLLCCKELRKNTIWLTLRGYDEEKTQHYITQALRHLSGKPFHPFVEQWFASVCETIRNSVIVLDDLPKILPGGRLARSLALLLKAAQHHAVDVLSTSYYPVQIKTTDSIPPVYELAVPRLSNDEVSTLLVLAGAPETIQKEKAAGFIVALTQGLPALVGAIVEFLKARGWVIDSQGLESIFRGDFAPEIAVDAKAILERTVDQDTRALLYRLCLAIGPFSKRDIENVGKVRPTLKMPLELASGATSVWIQSLGKDRYSLSPMLRPLFSQNLGSDTTKGVHAALALGRTSKRVLDPIDVQCAFHHFTMAELYPHAAMILIRALLKLNDMDELVEDEWGITNLWIHSPIPPDVPTSLTVFLRALQIVAADARSRDVSLLVSDFERHLEDSSPDAAWGQLAGLGLLGIRLYSKYPTLANSYVVKASRLISKVRLPDGSSLQMPENLDYLGLLWATANSSKSDDDVLHWLETIGGLTPEETQELINSDLAHDNSLLLCDTVWLREYKKPADEQNWDRILKILLEIQRTANRQAIPLLEAASIRTQIMVLAESKQLLGEAIALAESCLDKFKSDSIALFLISEVIGRQLSYANGWPDALHWMREALELNLTAFPLQRRNLLITYSAGIAIEDAAKAVEYTAAAVSLTRREKLAKFRAVESLAEHTIALWLSGERIQAFDYWQELTNLMVGCRADERDAYWRRLIKTCLQVSAYFCSSFVGRKLADSERLPPPARGLFLGLGDGAESPIEPIQLSILLLRNAIIAEGLGSTELAGTWTDLALADAKDKPGAGIVETFAWLGIAPAILAENLEKAFALISTMESRRAPDPELISSVLGAGANQRTRTFSLEETASICQQIGLVPMVFRLVAASAKRDVSEDVEKIIRFCNQRALNLNQTSWNQAAETVQYLFANKGTWKEAYETGQRLFASARPSLALMYCLSAALDAPLPTSVQIQISIAYRIDHLYALNRSLCARVIWPSIGDFWLGAAKFRQEEFRTGPSYTQSRLENLLADPMEIAIRGVLKEMAFCTGADLADWMKNWLESA